MQQWTTGEEKNYSFFFGTMPDFHFHHLSDFNKSNLIFAALLMHLKIDFKSFLKATVSYHDFLDSFVTLPLNCQFNTKEKF